MRAALVLALTLALPAHAQLAPTGHAGLDEFARICLLPKTLDFTVSAEDQARLGLQKENHITITEVPEDLAAKPGVPDTLMDFAPAYVMHGTAKDLYLFNIWSAQERPAKLVGRVDAGQGMLGIEGNSAPMHFCSMLTMGNPSNAWAAFDAHADGAVPLYHQKEPSLLWGPRRVWLLDLPWAPDHTGLVTITEPSLWARAPAVTVIVIEVVAASDLERVLEGLAGANKSI